VGQLRIRRCVLRLRRHGGWSWGPDPASLVHSATQSLPRLLADRLELLLADAPDEVTIPRLQIRIPVRLAELMDPVCAPAEGGPATVVSSRIDDCCRRSLSEVIDIAPAEAAEPADSLLPEEADLSPSPGEEEFGIALLIRWHEEGALARIVRSLDDELLQSLEELSLSSLPTTMASAHQRENSCKLAEQLVHDDPQTDSAPSRPAVKRLVLLIALLRAVGRTATQEELLAALDHCMPTAAPRSATKRSSQIEHDLEPQSERSKVEVQGKRQRAGTRPERVLTVTSVVPFLAVGVLSRLGYFSAVSTFLAALGRTADYPYLVAALAYKMLPPPLRGWRREDADRLTAAAIAGRREIILDAAIDRLARSCPDGLSLADSFLRQQALDRREPSSPVFIDLVCLADHELWGAWEARRRSPLGWFQSPLHVAAAVDDVGDATVILDEAATDPALTAELTRCRRRFVTTAPPGRHDRWRALVGPRRLWTNDWDTAEAQLVHDMDALKTAQESARRVRQAFLADRPVVMPTRQLPADQSSGRRVICFEQSLAFAAAFALSRIAQDLWGLREPTDALLTLERLGTLEAEVTFDDDRILVRPSLGKRSLDLRQGGFLRDVAALPWSGGRRLEFATL